MHDIKAITEALNEISDEVGSLEEEVARLENRCATLEGKLEESEVHNEKLLNDISELNDYVQDLETALAEAHLMSLDDGPEVDEVDPVV